MKVRLTIGLLAILLVFLLVWWLWRPNHPSHARLPQASEGRSESSSPQATPGKPGPVPDFSRASGLRERILKQTYGSIEVKGHVVDENGAPLGGVEMFLWVAQAPKGNSGSTGSQEHIVTKSDGFFSFSYRNIGLVQCRLVADGRAGIVKEYNIGAGGPEVTTDANGQRSIRIANERITMPATPGIDTMRYWHENLKYDARSDFGSIIRTKGFTGNSRLENMSLYEVLWRVPIKEGVDLPEHSIALYCKSENGRIIMFPPANDEERRKECGTKWGYVATPVLIMSSPDDGFILYKSADSVDPQYSHIMREMRVAPETGYSQSLVLPNDKQSSYVFLRIAGKYAKSELVRISTKDGHQILFPFRVYLQRDGSRNLVREGD